MGADELRPQPEGANEKLIQAKQNVAEQRAARGIGTGAAESARDRLPPGQKLIASWQVLDLGLRPEVPTATWQLAVFGAVLEPRTFTWEQFRALPQTRLVTDFHCVTGWSVYDAEVEGLLWHDLLRVLQPRPEATHCLFHCHDGYTTNLSLDDLGRENVAIVHSFGGKPLEREHGGPARTWVPHLYAWKYAKWVKGIEFLAGDKPGFWEVRGYHNRGDPWKEERYNPDLA